MHALHIAMHGVVVHKLHKSFTVGRKFGTSIRWAQVY